jgi:hypothetical protein
MGERKNDPVTQGALTQYRQRMDSAVLLYQARLLSEDGEAWHQVLLKVMERDDPQKVLALLASCDTK